MANRREREKKGETDSETETQREFSSRPSTSKKRTLMFNPHEPNCIICSYPCTEGPCARQTPLLTKEEELSYRPSNPGPGGSSDAEPVKGQNLSGEPQSEGTGSPRSLEEQLRVGVRSSSHIS